MITCRFVGIDIGSCMVSGLVEYVSNISDVLSDCNSRLNINLVSIGN
ncbi:hypothetical protein KC947_01115 [Candidatus Saccharibacteria bacterium]|nr:hypothetical protein [Candidatus Saccharibacteria bacterium]